VTHFLEVHCRRLKRAVPKVSEAAMLELETRDYRGNVRELSNLIERGLLLTDPGEVMAPEHLFDRPLSEAAACDGPAGGDTGQGLYGAVAGFERGFIKKALDRNMGSRTRTAKDLGISTRWLTKKMKRLGLIEEDDDTSDDDDADGDEG
jgi:DNA-binding NtrC family response regulator